MRHPPDARTNLFGSMRRLPSRALLAFMSFNFISGALNPPPQRKTPAWPSALSDVARGGEIDHAVTPIELAGQI